MSRKACSCLWFNKHCKTYLKRVTFKYLSYFNGIGFLSYKEWFELILLWTREIKNRKTFCFHSDLYRYLCIITDSEVDSALKEGVKSLWLSNWTASLSTVTEELAVFCWGCVLPVCSNHWLSCILEALIRCVYICTHVCTPVHMLHWRGHSHGVQPPALLQEKGVSFEWQFLELRSKSFGIVLLILPSSYSRESSVRLVTSTITK